MRLAQEVVVRGSNSETWAETGIEMKERARSKEIIDLGMGNMATCNVLV